MGYYSETALGVRKETFNKYKAEVGFGEYDYMVEKPRNHGDFYVFYWPSIKWYDSYEDIIAVENFLDYCENNDEDMYFLRLGEDVEDVEERWAGDSYEIWNNCFQFERRIALEEEDEEY